LPLHWIGILRGVVGCSIAATSGVHEGADALKQLLVGADVAMTTSALLHRGPQHVATMLRWIREWMKERDYDSVEQLKGSVSRPNSSDPEAYERANYYHVLHSWRT
jgi:dihydroorotate dehydrogenase (fumarate)